ncbi:hypothetical protein [Spongiactinospora sp. 9N601]|uniref:hypothetical protein n=1 Tax=Spongiactinospora sp. 9N601 TaxID=3375149 RepID=UPI003796F829
MDKLVLSWLQLLGFVLELAGLICSTDWLRRRAGSVVGLAGKIVYVPAFAFIGGFGNAWIYRTFGAGRLGYLVPDYLPWVGGAMLGVIIAGMILVAPGDGTAGALLAYLAARIVIAVPGATLLLWILQSLFDCSSWPAWIRIGTYDCSPLDWLRFRMLYLGGLMAICGLAWLLAALLGGAPSGVSQGGEAAADGVSRSAVAAVGLIAMGMLLSSALGPMLDIIGAGP